MIEPTSSALDPTADPATQDPKQRWTYARTVQRAKDLGLEFQDLDSFELDLKPLPQSERGVIATAAEATGAPALFRGLAATNEEYDQIRSRLSGTRQILDITKQLLDQGVDPRAIRVQLNKQFDLETDRAFGARLDQMANRSDGLYAEAFAGYDDMMADFIKSLPEKDIIDAVKDYDYETLIPVWGMIQGVRSDIELYQLLQKSAGGKTTLEEDERITKYLIETYRPKTTGAQVYDGVMTSLQFVGDMFVGGVGAKAIKGGLGYAMKRMGVELAEDGVRNAVMRSMQGGMLGHLRNAASGQGFVAKAARAGEGAITMAGRTARESVRLAEQYTVNVGASRLLSTATGAANENPISGLADRINVEEALANAAAITGFNKETGEIAWESLATTPLSQVDWPDHIKALIEYGSERVSNILFPGQGNVLRQYGAAAQSYPFGRVLFPGIKPQEWAEMVARNEVRNLVPIAPLSVKGGLVELFEEQAARFAEVGAGKAGWLSGEEEEGSWADAFPTIDEWLVEAMTVGGTMGFTEGMRRGGGKLLDAAQPFLEDPGMRRRREAAEAIGETDRAAAATPEEAQAFASSLGLVQGEVPEQADAAVKALSNMGIRLQFYKPTDATPENEAKAGGFFNEQVRSTIWVNSDTFGSEQAGFQLSQAIGQLAYHEGWHSVSDVLGQDWRTMISAAESTREWQAAGEQYDADAQAAGLPTRDQLTDERSADEAAATIAERNWRVLFGATEGAKRTEVRKAIRDLLNQDGALLERMWRKTRQMLRVDLQESGLKKLQAAGLLGGIDDVAEAADRVTAIDSLLEAMDVAAIVRGRKQTADMREQMQDAMDAPETQHLTEPLRAALDEALADVAAEPAAPQEPEQPAATQPEGAGVAPAAGPSPAMQDAEAEAVRLTMQTALQMRNEAEALRQQLEAAPATMPRQERQRLKKQIRGLERESDKLLGDLEGELQGLPLDELQARVEAQQPSPFRGSTPLSRELTVDAPVRLRQRNRNYTPKIGKAQQSDPWVIENLYEVEGVPYASIGNAALNQRMAVPVADLVSAQEGVELQGPASMPIVPGSLVRPAQFGADAQLLAQGAESPDAVRVVDVTGPEGAQRAKLETGDIVPVDQLVAVDAPSNLTLGEQERLQRSAEDALRGQSRFARARTEPGRTQPNDRPVPGRQPGAIVGLPVALDEVTELQKALAKMFGPRRQVGNRQRTEADRSAARTIERQADLRGEGDRFSLPDMVLPPPVMTPWSQIPLPEVMEQAQQGTPLDMAAKQLEAAYRNGLFSEQQVIAYSFMLMSLPQDRVRDTVLQLRFRERTGMLGAAGLIRTSGKQHAGRLILNPGQSVRVRQEGLQRQTYGRTFLHELGHMISYDDFIQNQKAGPVVQMFARLRDVMLREGDSEILRPELSELFGEPLNQLSYYLESPRFYNELGADFARGGELSAELMARAIEDRGRGIIMRLGLFPELAAVFQRGATLAERAAMGEQGALGRGTEQQEAVVGSLLDISRALATVALGTDEYRTAARATLDYPGRRISDNRERQAAAVPLEDALGRFDTARRDELSLDDRLEDLTDREVRAAMQTASGQSAMRMRRDMLLEDQQNMIGAAFGRSFTDTDADRNSLADRMGRLAQTVDAADTMAQEETLRESVADLVTEQDVENVRQFVADIGQAELDRRSRFAAPKSVPAPLQVATNQAPIAGFQKLTQKFNEGNREANLAQLVSLERLIPNPLTSTRMWHKLVKTAFGDQFSVAPPRRLIDGVRDPQTLREQLANLDADQIMHANEGIELTDVLRARYENGEMTPTDTGDLFVWAFLSRMLSAAPHESAFLMAYENGLSRFTERIAQGQWTAADEQEWASWVKGWLPVLAEEDKKQLHGEWMSSAKTNLNAIGGSEGRDTSWAMNVANARVNGRPLLQVVHEALEDPNTTGKDVRRLFLSHAGQSGMGTKLVSFVMLVAGKRDVFVIDRWQARNMWPQFSEAKKPMDPYDGIVVPGQFNKKGKPVTAGVANILDGPSGLALYEGMERGMLSALAEAYDGTNRQPDVGRYHWESWLLVSSQAVGHASLRRFTGDGSIAGLGVIEGRQNRDTFEQAFVYLSDGTRGYVIEDTHGVPRFFTPDEYARRPKGKSKKAQQSAIEYVQSVGRELSGRDLDALSWIPGVARFRAERIESRPPSRLAPKPGQSDLDATVEALKRSGALPGDFDVASDLISQFSPLQPGESLSRSAALASDADFAREETAYFRELDAFARDLTEEQEAKITESVNGIVPGIVEAAARQQGWEDLNELYGISNARINMLIGGLAVPGIDLSSGRVQLHMLRRIREQLFAMSDSETGDRERQQSLRMMAIAARLLEAGAAKDVIREFDNRYSAQPPVDMPSTEGIAPMPGMRMGRRLWAVWKDRLTRLSDFEEYVGLLDPQLANLPADRSPLRRAELATSRESGLILGFNERHLAPFLKAGRDAGLNDPKVFSDFEDYLIARHAPEANKVLERRAAEADMLEARADELAQELRGKGGQMLTEAEVRNLSASDRKALKDEIAQMRATAKAIRPRLLYEVYETEQANEVRRRLARQYPGFARLARRIDGMVSDTRDFLLETEVISAEQHAEWSKFKYYVPLRGWETDAGYAEPSALNKRAGFSTWGPVALLRGGRDSRPDSPVVYVLNQAYEAIQRGVSNEVGLAFYKLATSVPAQVLSARRLRPGEQYSRRGMRRDAHFRLNIKGVPHSITLADVDLARAMANVGVDGLPKFLRGVRVVTRTQARLNTTMSPTFSVSNIFRDVEYAIAKSQVWQDSGLNIGVADIMKNLTLVGPTVSMFSMQRSPQGEMADLYRRAREAGAFTGWRQSVTVENVRRDLKAEMQRGNLRRVMNMMGIALELASQTSEEAVRFAVFKSALDAGATEAEAALLAKESTVNFDRVGYAGQWVNVHTMFWNAGFEGSMNFIRAAKRSKKFRRVLGGLVMASAAHYIMMRGLMGQGPDDKYEYATIPSHRRHRTAIIPIGDTYFQMPIAYGLNVFWALGQEAAAMALGDKEPSESAYDLLTTSLQAFSPVPSGPTLNQLLAPSALDPFVQAGENVTWYGGDITSPFLLERNLPDHLKTPDASRAAKEATQAIFNLLGGDAMKPSPLDDARDFTPDTFDHIMNSVFGTLGRDIWRTVDKVYREEGAPARPDKTPVMGAFIYQTPELPVQRTFYDIREQTGRVVEMIDEVLKTDPQRGEQLIERHEVEYAHGKAFEAQHQALADVRRLMNAATTDEERQQHAQAITDSQAELIRAYEAELLKLTQQKPAGQGEVRPVTLKLVLQQLDANRAALKQKGYKVE